MGFEEQFFPGLTRHCHTLPALYDCGLRKTWHRLLKLHDRNTYAIKTRYNIS
jgi:hypothetical protein